MRQMIEGNRNYGGEDRDDRMLRDVDIEDNGINETEGGDSNAERCEYRR